MKSHPETERGSGLPRKEKREARVKGDLFCAGNMCHFDLCWWLQRCMHTLKLTKIVHFKCVSGRRRLDSINSNLDGHVIPVQMNCANRIATPTSILGLRWHRNKGQNPSCDGQEDKSFFWCVEVMALGTYLNLFHQHSSVYFYHRRSHFQNSHSWGVLKSSCCIIGL